MANSELADLIRQLAAELENSAFTLNPEKTTPVYGDLHDFFSRMKNDGKIPDSFETHVFLGGIHASARDASRDLMALADLSASDNLSGTSEVTAYLSSTENQLSKFMTGFKDLLDKLPSVEGTSLKDLNPYKRAALGFQNSLRIIEDLDSRIKIAMTSAPVSQESEQPVETKKVAIKPDAAILYDEKEEAYLRRLYTTAEFIISRNISDSIRRKYIDVEIFESRYSFLTRDFTTESEMKSNERQYRISEGGPFPYVTLLIFVKEFANVILLSTLAWNARKTSPTFVEKFMELKGLTFRLMERILAMPRMNLKSHDALNFIRVHITPLVNQWVKDVINPIIMGRTKYYEELGVLSRGLTNRINTIYRIEGAGK